MDVAILKRYGATIPVLEAVWIDVLVAAAIGPCVMLATGCSSHDTTSTQLANPTSSTTHTVAPSTLPVRPTTVTREATDTLIGLIADARSRPDSNVLDTFATGFHWSKAPPETNGLLNSKVGYVGTVAGRTAFLGSDGTNDILAIALRDEFQPNEAIAELKQVYTLAKQDTEDSDGTRYETYLLIDHGDDLGVLTLTYGLADAIRGTGSIGFMAMKRFNKEIAKHRGEP